MSRAFKRWLDGVLWGRCAYTRERGFSATEKYDRIPDLLAIVRLFPAWKIGKEVDHVDDREWYPFFISMWNLQRPPKFRARSTVTTNAAIAARTPANVV